MTETNNKQIQISVLGVFAIIFGLLIWFINTDYFIKKDYLDLKKLNLKQPYFQKKMNTL